MKFKGTITTKDGAKDYTNVKEYNEAIEKIIASGIDFNASTKTYTETRANEACATEKTGTLPRNIDDIVKYIAWADKKEAAVIADAIDTEMDEIIEKDKLGEFTKKEYAALFENASLMVKATKKYLTNVKEDIETIDKEIDRLCTKRDTLEHRKYAMTEAHSAFDEMEELAATRLNEEKCTCQKDECGSKYVEPKEELTEDDLKSALDDLKKICREIFK